MILMKMMKVCMNNNMRAKLTAQIRIMILKILKKVKNTSQIHNQMPIRMIKKKKIKVDSLNFKKQQQQKINLI